MTLGLNTRTSGTRRRGCWRKYSPLCSPKATSPPPTAPKDLRCSLYVLLLLFVFSHPPLRPPPPPCLATPRSRSLMRSMLLWQRQKREAAAGFCEVWRMFCFWPVRESATQFCFFFFFEASLCYKYSLIIRCRPNEMFLRRPWERFFSLSNFFFFRVQESSSHDGRWRSQMLKRVHLHRRRRTIGKTNTVLLPNKAAAGTIIVPQRQRAKLLFLFIYV